MSKKVLTILIGIIAIAAILRFWNLGSVPLSPDWDEAALGYNAYSILHTGHDEFGQFLPLVLKSFGDYKPALYSYLIIPFLFLFDLSAVAVRMPSAVFGILTVGALYFLAKELFGREDFALASAFFLAISPWHIQFSRVGFESNVGLALNVFMVLFFLKGLKKNWFLVLSAICAALSLYTYQSEKIFTPLMLITLIILYRKQFFKVSRRYIWTFFLTGIIVILPLVFYTISTPSSLSRATSTSVFSSSQILQKDVARLSYDSSNADILGQIFDNRRVVYGKQIISNYLSHFDPNWLFVRGDIPRHHAPGLGLLYFFELPLILSGIYFLIFYSHKFNLSKIVVFCFLILAPLPSALAQDAPHAVRALNMVPFFAIASGLGSVSIYIWINEHIKKDKIRNALLGVIALCFLFNFAFYLNQYFIQQNYFYAKDWQYGYLQAESEVSKIKDKYSKVIVDNVTPMDQSYIFFLFHGKYPPEIYQQISHNHTSNDKTFENLEFRPVNWNNDKNLKNALIIGTPGDFPGDVKQIQEVKYPDGTTAMKFVEGRK